MNQLKVADFRNLISRLNDITGCHAHSCVGENEVAHNVRSAKRVGSELINSTCPRATEDDEILKERAVDRSTMYILKNS